MMKHRISAFLLAVLLAVTAAGCSAQEPEDSAGLPESSAGTAVRSEAFYPAEAGYTDYDGSPIQGWSGWNADGTFTFQNRNTLTTLSRENQVLETITLPEEALPGSEYSLDRSDDYILTLSNPASMNEPYGVVYYTDSGTVCLANLTLFDRQGNPVRQYPRSQVYAYDENDQKICLLPCPEGEEVAEVYGIGNAMPIYWLDGHTAIFDCHSFIIFYDFAADSGQVLDDMSEIVKHYGKFGVYYGSQMGGVVDGTYYYLTRRESDPISGYTLWAADADGARELLDGQRFWHLFAAKDGLVLVDDINPADPESDSRVWYLPTGSTQPTLIWGGDLSLPFTEADQIAFFNWNWSLDSSVLYSYDPVTGTLSSRDLGECIQIDGLFTLVRDGSLRYYYSQYKDGERTSWVYDTATDTTTPLTRFDGNLYVSWLSPDGRYWVEQDPSTDDPRLRVSRWEYLAKNPPPAQKGPPASTGGLFLTVPGIPSSGHQKRAKPAGSTLFLYRAGIYFISMSSYSRLPMPIFSAWARQVLYSDSGVEFSK